MNELSQRLFEMGTAMMRTQAAQVDDETGYEPDYDDEVRCCPNCERPNQFGELCFSCIEDERRENDMYAAADDALSGAFEESE